MKESPADRAQRLNLEASKFSAEGFTGSDIRSFGEIVSSDTMFLEKKDVRCEDIARALEIIFDLAVKNLGAKREVVHGVTARYHESMGKIPSPFRGEGVFEKGDVEVAFDGTTVFLSRLSIHLIKEHCFFQGKGSRYRLEPEEALSLYEIVGNV